MHITQEKLMGMTTNERLFETGLISAYDQAVKVRDINKIRSILSSVFVDHESIELIVGELAETK